LPRMVDLNVTTYWWISGDAGIANPDAVSAAVLTAAKNISPYVVATTNVGPTSSDTVSEKGITDTSNAVVPIIGNYEGSLVLFRDLTAGVPTVNDPLTTIGATSGLVGWIVKRIGKASGAAAAAADKVDVYKFTTDTPVKSGGQGDGYLKATVGLLPAGTFRVETTLVA